MMQGLAEVLRINSLVEHLHFSPQVSTLHSTYSTFFLSRRTLFTNKRFVLNEMFQQNASKFAIFYLFYV